MGFDPALLRLEILEDFEDVKSRGLYGLPDLRPLTESGGLEALRKAYRDRHVEKGLCIYCPRHAVVKKGKIRKYCVYHQAQLLKRVKEYQARNREKILKSRAQNREKILAARRARRKKLPVGSCEGCGGEAQRDRVRCASCLQEQAASSRKYYWAKKMKAKEGGEP